MIIGYIDIEVYTQKVEEVTINGITELWRTGWDRQNINIYNNKFRAIPEQLIWKVMDIPPKVR